jgi:hypothetical protein
LRPRSQLKVPFVGMQGHAVEEETSPAPGRRYDGLTAACARTLTDQSCRSGSSAEYQGRSALRSCKLRNGKAVDLLRQYRSHQRKGNRSSQRGTFLPFVGHLSREIEVRYLAQRQSAQSIHLNQCNLQTHRDSSIQHLCIKLTIAHPDFDHLITLGNVTTFRRSAVFEFHTVLLYRSRPENICPLCFHRALSSRTAVYLLRTKHAKNAKDSLLTFRRSA